MTLSDELTWRGFVNQTTFSSTKSLDKLKITFYHGYDASADSQTVGNLAAMMLDRCLMRHGHKAIILLGGATSLIGDPGGKDSERQLQPERVIQKNVKCAEDQIKKVLAGYKYRVVNNLSWTKNLHVIDYLRDYGKHFNMTQLVQRDYISKRLGKDGPGISYAEFSYTVLQGIDYLNLFDKYDCTLQLGGADQWGNCLSGVELIRKTRGVDVHVLTLPIIVNKLTGKKFGKSETGTVWLDPKKTSPTEFYQFWVNTDDDSVEDYLKIFTESDRSSIDAVMLKHKQEPHKRLAQVYLAKEVTIIAHGKKEALKAESVTNFLTGKSRLDSAKLSDIETIKSEIPSLRVNTGDDIIDVLVKTKLALSKTEARQLLIGNSIYINNQVVNRENFNDSDFQEGKLLLRRGKALKNAALIIKN